MNRKQLEHVLRAVKDVVEIREFIIVGSQSILGKYPNANPDLLQSMEIDIYPKDFGAFPCDIQGVFGEKSQFHDTHGFWVDGVDSDTSTLPIGWQNRLIKVQNENTDGAVGYCLNPNDLAIAKIVAGREKDLTFITVAIRDNLMNPRIIKARLYEVENLDKAVLNLALQRLEFITTSLKMPNQNQSDEPSTDPTP